MKKMIKITALLLCLSMLVSMIGCTQTPAETTAPPTTAAPTEPAPSDVYAQARVALDAADHISLELLSKKYTTVAGDEFSEQSAQTLTYKGVGTEEQVIVMEEQMDFSIHSPESDSEEDSHESMAYKEIWYQGNV